MAHPVAGGNARRCALGLLWLAAALAAPPLPTAHAMTYRIDPGRSEIVALVFKAGPASALAHDHVVRAARWQATLEVSRFPIALAAEIRVDATALEVDEPDARTRHGLDGTLSDGDRAQIRATMLGEGQLDAAAHPEITFRASEIDRAGDAFRLAGELGLHGVVQRITLPLAVSQDGDELTARGKVRVKQSDFGITPYRAFLGAVRTQDEVEIVFTLVAVPADTR